MLSFRGRMPVQTSTSLTASPAIFYRFDVFLRMKSLFTGQLRWSHWSPHPLLPDHCQTQEETRIQIDPVLPIDPLRHIASAGHDVAAPFIDNPTETLSLDLLGPRAARNRRGGGVCVHPYTWAKGCYQTPPWPHTCYTVSLSRSFIWLCICPIANFRRSWSSSVLKAFNPHLGGKKRVGDAVVAVLVVLSISTVLLNGCEWSVYSAQWSKFTMKPVTPRYVLS